MMPAAQNEGCQTATFCKQYSRYITDKLQLLGALHVRPHQRSPRRVRIKITETIKWKLRSPTVMYTKLFKVSVQITFSFLTVNTKHKQHSPLPTFRHLCRSLEQKMPIQFLTLKIMPLKNLYKLCT